MRPVDAEYDASLNKLSVNQDQSTRAVFEFIQAIRRKAADGQLTPQEVLQAAVEEIGDAATQLVELVKDPVPLGEDIYKVATGLVNQLQPFRGAEEPT